MTNGSYGYYETSINSGEDLVRFLNQVDYLTFAQIKDSRLRLGGRLLSNRQDPKLSLEDLAALWQYAQDNRPEDDSVFSLEPSYDYHSLKNTLVQAEPSLRSLTSGAAPVITDDDIQQAKTGLDQQDEIPYLQLIQKLANSNNPDVKKYGKMAMEQAMNYRFQVAHYGKDLQGTDVGMVLFYTDLLTKLWAIDYLNNSSKQDLTDVQPTQLATVTSTNVQQIPELSSIRVEFGSRDSAFQVVEKSNSLFLEPNASQLYAAAYNPLQPSESKTVSADAEAFLRWWRDRYEEEIVPNEPQYERLDEIIKWGRLMSWLHQTNQRDVLSFLDIIPVTNNYWFPNWAQTNSNHLKFPIWNQVNFYERGYKATTTEAMPILASQISKPMGKETILFSGRVRFRPRFTPDFNYKSRPRRQPDSPSYRKRNNPNSPSHTKPDPDSPSYRKRNNPNSPPNSQRKPDVPPINRTRQTGRAKENVKFRQPKSKIAPGQFKHKISRTVSGFQITGNGNGTAQGSLSVKRTQNGFQIGWRSRKAISKEFLSQDSTQKDASAQEAKFTEHIHNQRYDRIAEQVLKDPALLAKNYQPQLKHAHQLLAAKKYDQAAQHINGLIGLYGKRSDLMLLKGVTDIARGRQSVKQVTSDESGVSNQQVEKTFLDQVNQVLANSDGNGFRYFKTEKGNFYVQDTPGLNNINWQLGIKQTLPLIANKARRYQLKPGQIGKVPLSLSGVGDGTYSPKVEGNQTDHTPSSDMDCNNFDKQNNPSHCNTRRTVKPENQKSTYVVMEK